MHRPALVASVRTALALLLLLAAAPAAAENICLSQEPIGGPQLTARWVLARAAFGCPVSAARTDADACTAVPYDAPPSMQGNWTLLCNTAEVLAGNQPASLLHAFLRGDGAWGDLGGFDNASPLYAADGMIAMLWLRRWAEDAGDRETRDLADRWLRAAFVEMALAADLSYPSSYSVCVAGVCSARRTVPIGAEVPTYDGPRIFAPADRAIENPRALCIGESCPELTRLETLNARGILLAIAADVPVRWDGEGAPILGTTLTDVPAMGWAVGMLQTVTDVPLGSTVPSARLGLDDALRGQLLTYLRQPGLVAHVRPLLRHLQPFPRRCSPLTVVRWPSGSVAAVRAVPGGEGQGCSELKGAIVFAHKTPSRGLFVSPSPWRARAGRTARASLSASLKRVVTWSDDNPSERRLWRLPDDPAWVLIWDADGLRLGVPTAAADGDAAR